MSRAKVCMPITASSLLMSKEANTPSNLGLFVSQQEILYPDIMIES